MSTSMQMYPQGGHDDWLPKSEWDRQHGTDRLYVYMKCLQEWRTHVYRKKTYWRCVTLGTNRTKIIAIKNNEVFEQVTYLGWSLPSIEEDGRNIKSAGYVKIPGIISLF
jgi:hypothetical protein